MKEIISLTLFFVFITLALLHIYWGFGGKFGIENSVPKNSKNEKVLKISPLSCFIVSSFFLFFCLFVLAKASIIFLYFPFWLNCYGLCFLSAIFILRAIGDFKYVGFFKQIKATEFANFDSKYFSPLCVIIGILLFILNK